jgi:L-threonylcarbamoyladenylate synthase
MQTKVFKSDLTTDIEITQVCSILSLGGVIVFPTETVYGIGCDLFSETGRNKIYELKNRPSNLPLSAHVSSIEMALSLLTNDVPDVFFLLAENFLPGPLTIILEKNKSVPDFVTAGMGTIGIRFPDNKIALRIINNYGKPLAATSANISGNPSAIDCSEIIRDFSEKIPLMIDGGRTDFANESTVISLVGEKPVVIREGVIKINQIEDILKIKF